MFNAVVVGHSLVFLKNIGCEIMKSRILVCDVAVLMTHFTFLKDNRLPCCS